MDFSSTSHPGFDRPHVDLSVLPDIAPAAALHAPRLPIQSAVVYDPGTGSGRVDAWLDALDHVRRQRLD